MEKTICNNCGMVGHIYRDCRNPVCSFGIILLRNDYPEPKMLMIQRRNSLCYIEFLRGKYDINNKTYIINLFTKCCLSEKELLKTKNFDDLWCDLWKIKSPSENKDYLRRDYDNGKNKFTKLKNNINFFIDKSDDIYHTSEWEFPKGRRNKNETNYQTAIREFTEETGYLPEDYIILENLQTVKEEYTSVNNVNYRHIYNIGFLTNLDKDIKIDKYNEIQMSEVKDIKWLTKNEALDIIRDYHIYRKNIICNIFDLINDTNSITFI